MKEKFLVVLNVPVWRRVFLLTMLCFFVFSGIVFGQHKINKNNEKQLKKSSNHAGKVSRPKRKSQRKQVASSKRKASRKQIASRKRKASSKEITRFQTPKREDEFEGDQERRQESFLFERMYPFNKIPDDARRRAWLARPAEATSNRIAATATWKPIGPRPTTSDFPNNWGITSGRINAIAVSPANPQIVLVGGATGGVWRSSDGGTTFASVTDSHVDLAVGSITFAPSNANIVYAGMGDKASTYIGTGVLKSTDGGQTWARVSNNTLPAPGIIAKVEVDPANPNRVYVAQHSSQFGNAVVSGGFWYSEDGGVSWTRTLTGFAKDLVRHPTEAQTLFLAMENVELPVTTAGVFKSTNGGLTWTRIYTAPQDFTSNIKIAVAPSNGQIIYVFVHDDPRPRVEVTTNGGGMWTNLGSNTLDVGQFNYNCYIFVHPTDPNTVYIGTRDVWRSTNGGVNFTNITGNFDVAGQYNPFNSNSHPDQHHFYISPANPNTIYIANDGGIWKSTNGGTNFQSLNNTLGLTMFTSLAVHPTNANLSYGGAQDNGTQRRTGAESWTEFTSGDGGQTVIDAVDPSIVFSTYIERSITRWQNNGTTFDVQVGNNAVFNNDRTAFYPPFVGNGVNSNLYFGTYRLYISTNRGDTWNPPGGATDLTRGGFDLLNAIGVHGANPNTIYTGSREGRVMVSTNAGVNWEERMTGLPNRSIKSIIVSPANAAVAYLTVSGFDSGHVFKTTNSGMTWTDISNNLPNIPTNTLLIDPQNPNTLYVGTDIGIYRSQNDGGNWESLNNGFPPTIVSELVAQPGGLIQAATYGRGAYQLTVSRKTIADFDGDGKTDVSIFRPAAGEWWYQQSSDNVSKALAFGSSTDRIVPGDYDGDGKTDCAFWRPATGEWFVLRSSNLTFFAAPFGANGDTPAPGDFDGDAKTDFVVYRAATGTWFILKSTGGVQITPFGIAGDVPIVADYDGDGKDDIAIYRPTGGGGQAEWWMLRSTAGLLALPFGSATDKPVQGDYTGDGKADAAYWKPSTGEWFVLRSENLTYYAAPFGANGDVPVAGDYDGDGKYDLAVFRPASVTWFVLKSTGGSVIQAFGAAGDKPVPSAFVP